jgi:hypothetical protein
MEGAHHLHGAWRSVRASDRHARPREVDRHGRGEVAMLWTIAVLLCLLWLGGMISNYTLGGFIHVLLLLAIASILIRIIQGRRPV